nr:peptide ABC transporter substrate-binding protein [Anaerolineae bacterium]
MKHRSITTVALLLTGLITACLPPNLTATTVMPATPSPSALPSPTTTPTSTPTPTPPKEFTICQALEPNTLFIYGGPSRAAHNVLAGVYDGPIDTRMYQFQPVILEKIPSLADGDAVLRTVQAGEGDRVVDINGLAVDLLPGVTVINADGQEVTFESGVVTMTQMVVTFTLRADVTWADGQPLTADDSRYSFELAGEFESPTLRLLWERTYSYDVVDERTVVWTGVPGYHDAFYFLNFYHPLPRHLWGVADADQLLSAEVAHERPLGWGPFVVEEWVEGEHITLVRNPHYFRAAEGLPYLDRVTFRFVPDLRQALDLLVAGECDLITQDVIESGDIAPLLTAADAGGVRLVYSPSSEWEHLDFGIDPAGWVRRPDFFEDVRVRQAVAMCVDRERIAREALPYGEAAVAHSYVAPEHPLYAGGQLYRWDYDPSDGQSLLEEVGWRDEDGDGIREAHGVAGIANGIPFSVTLLTTDDHPARERTARILIENLAACGIGLAVQYLPAEEFFADGPDGPVFGRRFDLALFSWLNGPDAPCGLYLSTEVPGPENWWAASNNPGYASADYDAACQAALDALPGTEAYVRFHLEAQRIFSYDLPVLPLYFVPKLVATRPEVSGVILDPSEYLELWNIEAFDVTR